ncbi:MAG: CDP-glycerol glycerophosphotransferase family protein [Firmicutes bacterium]|nr:CDP-glycerol glycerophosphotransferase family protein [Bacillota bacterium]
MGIKRLKNALRAAKTNKNYLNCLNDKIGANTIVLESNQGRGAGKELSALLTCKELQDVSEDSKVYISYAGKAKKEIEAFLEELEVSNVTLVKRNGEKYRQLLATAGRIITDNALPAYFIKREGQRLVVLDTVMGYPEGRSHLSESLSLGLIQKTILSADEIEGDRDAVLREYMVGSLLDGSAKLYYAGDLTRADIRALVGNVIKGDDAEKIAVAFENEMKPAAVQFLGELGDNVDFVQIIQDGAITFEETVSQYMYKSRGMMAAKAKAYYQREGKRLFSGINVSEIHFLSTELYERIEMILLSGYKTVFHKIPMLFYRRLIDVFLDHPKKIDEVISRFDSVVEYDQDFAKETWGSNICCGVLARFKGLNLSSDDEFLTINTGLIIKAHKIDAKLENKFVIGSMTYDKRFEYDAEVKETGSSVQNGVVCTNYSVSVKIPCDDVNGWFIKNLPLAYLKFGDVTLSVPVITSGSIGALKKKVYNIGKTGCALELRDDRRHVRFGIKEQKVSDQTGQRILQWLAFICHIITFWNKPVVLCEKYCKNYEESASILFERLVDDGYKNVRYILNKDSFAGQGIDPKYRKYIVDQFSFKHYYNLFAAKSIISSEAIGHSLEKGTSSWLFKNFVEDGSKNYIFLQHGVMYMVALSSEQRSFFRKGKGKGKQRVVCSSKLEANHFTDYTNYEQEDLYICGLIKFDRSILSEGADKILVMLTWRPWEFVTGISGMKETAYYKMLQRIVRSIPDDLKDKLIVMPHPLLSSQAKLETDDEVWKYYVHGRKYDDILKETKLLITDYSSIAYDAFFRGTSVIFDWEEKDACMKEYGSNGRLMLTEDLAFGDVCYDSDKLTESVIYGYNNPQKEEHINNYRRIVEFSDRDNCGRFIEMAKADGIL